MTVPLRVLILEDRAADAELMAYQLRQAGFEPTWKRVDRECDYLAGLDPPPDVILADHSLPGFDSVRALRLLQERGLDVPFIIVSGTISEELAVSLLKQGAADYVLKDRMARLGPAVQRELAQAEVARARRRAEEQSRLLVAAVTAATNAIFITDRNGKIEWTNEAFCRLSGYAMEELIGQTPRVLRSGKQDSAFYERLWQAILAGEVWNGEVVERRRDGSIYVVNQTITPILDGKGYVSHFVAVHEDITRRKHAEAQVQHLAYHDALTDLPNRTLFHEQVSQAMAAARRGNRLLAVHFLDLDRFKSVNDRLGHPAGDALLQAVAQRLRGCIRECDLVSRFGGDEFAILQTDLQRVEGAAVLARKVLEVLARPFVIAGQEVQTSGSVGITVFPLDNGDTDRLLCNADLALYLAKREGRNNFQFFTEALDAQVRDRLALEIDLRHAAGRGDLLLHYQPQLDLQTGRVVGLEALTRWRHPSRGLLQPAQFIPIAEDCGLIDPLTWWVLEQACRDSLVWKKAGLGLLRVAVNVSASSFKEDTLVPAVIQALRRTGLPANSLELEVTETVFLQPRQVADTMRRLRQAGVVLSVDDFGTGYSSLYYLRRLPLDKLKIDQSFVHDLPRDADNTAITRAIIDLGHSLNLRVIAEGVETAGHLGCLREWGCDEGQGFYFSRPLPAEAVEEFCRERSEESGSRIHARGE